MSFFHLSVSLVLAKLPLCLIMLAFFLHILPNLVLSSVAVMFVPYNYSLPFLQPMYPTGA